MTRTTLNEMGLRWLEAAAASAPDATTAEMIRQRIKSDEEGRKRAEIIRNFRYDLYLFSLSPEFEAVKLLLQGRNEEIQLSAHGMRFYYLSNKGIEEMLDERIEVVHNTDQFENAATAFLDWKGPNIKPSEYLAGELNALADKALSSVTVI